MSNYDKKRFKNINEAKSFFRDEAWEYFKKRHKLPLLTDRLGFELYAKDENLKNQWGAFRHAYTSAAFTKTYGKTTAKLAGDANEIIQFGSIKSYPSLTEHNAGNEPLDRRMDLKNNAVGRKIGEQNNGVNLLDEVYYNLGHNPEMVIDQNVNNNTPYKDNAFMSPVWEAADKAYYEKKASKPSSVNKTQELATGLYKDEPVSNYNDIFLKDQIKSKAANQKNLKHVTLEELKASQEARKQKVHDMIQNAHKRKEANKNKTKSSGSGMVYVREYTRSDGIRVSDYYRRR